MLLIIIVFAKLFCLEVTSAHFLTQDFINQYLINNGPLKPYKRCPRQSLPDGLAAPANSNNAISFGNNPSGLPNDCQGNNAFQNVPLNLQNVNNLNNLPYNLPVQSLNNLPFNLPVQSLNNVPFNRLLPSSNSMNNGQPLNNFVPSNGFRNINNMAASNGLPNANIQYGNGLPNVNYKQIANSAPNINSVQFGSNFPNSNNLPISNGLPNANNIPCSNGLAVNNIPTNNIVPNYNGQVLNGFQPINNLPTANLLANNIPCSNGLPVNNIPTNNIVPNYNGQVLNGYQHLNNLPTGNGFLNGNNIPPINFMPNIPGGPCNNLMPSIPNINTNVNNFVPPSTTENSLPSYFNLPANNFVYGNNLPLNNIVPSSNNMLIPNGLPNVPQSSLPIGIQNPLNYANQQPNNCNCLPNALTSYNNLPIANQGSINNIAMSNAQPSNIASLPIEGSNVAIANGLQMSSISNPFLITNNEPVQTFNPYQNLSNLPGSSITNSVSFINPAINTGRLFNDGLANGTPINELPCNNSGLNNNMPVDFSLANLPVKRNILQNEWLPTNIQIENQDDMSNSLNIAKELANKLIIEGFGNLPIFNGLPVAGITETVTVLNNPCECS